MKIIAFLLANWDSVLEEAKKAWGANGNIAAYIEPEPIIRMTRQEAEEIAAALNAVPGTFAPGKE